MKSYQIHFIRHGITVGNIKGQYIGSTDLPLCDEGKKQLEQLSAEYEYPGAEAIFVSPMKRCIQTVELLYPNAKPIIIRELRECDFGELEGLTAQQLADNKDFSKWLSADKDFVAFGGESGEHFSERVCSTFEAIVDGLIKTGTTSSIIVTHGGVISMLLSKYGLPEAAPTEWMCEPGCGYTVRIHPSLWMSGRVMEVTYLLPYEKESDEEDE